MALELIPTTAAARAHTHPLGTTLTRPSTSTGPAAGAGFGLRPQDLHGAYELPTSAPTTQTIALVDAYNDPTAEEDLKVYSEEFGLPACTTANHCFTKINQEGNTSPMPETEGSWAVEISLDLEAAHAVCQSCHIMLVEANSSFSNDLEAAEQRAVAEGATEISNSFGGPGFETGAYNHPGVVITASTGDYGYNNWVSPSWGERANFPAASPNVVAVGGTRLQVINEAWSWETPWGEGGSGCGSATAPTWQQAVPDWSEVGCGSNRAVADVSADGDPYSGLAVYDSTPFPPYGLSPWKTIAGTSLSSPIVAATFALAGGARGVEYPAQTLYSHLGSAYLHDVTSGSNWGCTKINKYGFRECTAGEYEQNCSHELICNAAPGYDGPTGVGSPHGVAAFQPDSSTPPVVTSVTPSEGTTSGGTSVTINGTGLGGASFVHFGSANAQITADTDHAITAISPAREPGTVDITVTGNAGLRSAETSADHYTYGVPKPSVDGVAPAEGPASGGTTVTITGANLAGVQYVQFGGYSARLVSIAEHSLTVVSPAHGPGVADIVVGAAYGVTSAESGLDHFTYIPPPPAVTSVSPSEGTGAGGTTVTIWGVGLGKATAVHFGGTAGTIIGETEGSREGEEEEESASSVTAITPEHEAGAVDITVTNAGGTTSAFLADRYVYTARAPVVTSVTPHEGPTAGGTPVTITGANLGGATLVRFGYGTGVITSDTGTTITATTPVYGPGPVPVTVTTAGGSSNPGGSSDQYTYVNPTYIVGTANPLTTLSPFGTSYTPHSSSEPPRVGVLGFAARAFAAGVAPTLRLTLSTTAVVVVSVSKIVSGRRVHHRCLTQATRGQRCTTPTHVVTVNLQGSAGTNSLRLPLTRLKPGSYVATVSVLGGTERTTTLRFSVSPRRQRRHA
jgi:hypothetical protein